MAHKGDIGRSTEPIRRKLQAIAATLLDPAAPGHERANAEALKIRLEKKLAPEATFQGIWTGAQT
jgi:hypothetical protein